MTLQNGLIYNRQAYLWSDTAFWNEKGKRIGSAPKVFTGTLWPWAATFSGVSPGREPDRIVNLMSKQYALSPERLLSDAVEVLRSEKKKGRDNRLLFAWPCPQLGARMWHIASEEMPGRHPLQAVQVSKYLCWGGDSDWYAPYADRDMTPEDMREVIALQLHDTGREMFDMEMEDPISDVIETRVSQAGISLHVYRLVHGGLVEVPALKAAAEPVGTTPPA